MPLGAASGSSVIEVELLIGCGGFTACQILTNSECYDIYSGVRRRVLRSAAEREITQTISQGPQIYAKLIQRGAIALTARMLAWKQPFIQRVRNSSLVERLCMDDNRAQSILPKLQIVNLGQHWQGSIPVAQKMCGNACWSGWKSKCRHKQRQCGWETRTPQDQGFLINANRIRVSRVLRRIRKEKSMDNMLIFMYQQLLRWEDRVVKGLRTDGIVR
eukprot:TRINITY_DN492_c0_g1_i3.p2 TRINITY_DN492_c0_g1~~TRINITY_DN492_c0_g1_i3.p2  ORF type:complete len:217 (+),score=-41.00 TRINITY_DN492_c0_g1_i3:85-735(+)